jgi:hypothetical protein
VGGKGGGRGKGGVMTQSLYAHMNKGNQKKKERKRNGIGIVKQVDFLMFPGNTLKLNYFRPKC